MASENRAATQTSLSSSANAQALPSSGATGKSATGSPSHAAIARRYLIAALGCALFAFVYAQFSHGVYSPFMTFMFAIPLLGGAAVTLALHFARAKAAPRLARQSWALALAALAIGSCLRGIFEIAGTSSPYLIAYPAIAAIFAAVAAFALVFQAKGGSRQALG